MRSPAAEAQIVPAETYPPLLPRARRREALSLLRSPDTLQKADRLLAIWGTAFQGAVADLADRLREAARRRDWRGVYDATHEIRGMAATAGLPEAGRIANSLCLYLDTMAGRGHAPDAAVADLHFRAILRAVRTADDAARHGEAVAQELAALVARKLNEIKDSASP